MVDTVNSPSPSHLQVSVMPRSQAFSINPVTGAVEVVGRVLAGSAFTLTVQVQGHHYTVEKSQGDHYTLMFRPRTVRVPAARPSWTWR